MSKNKHITKNNKNSANIKSVSMAQKKNNTIILSDYYKSPKNSTIIKTISNISNISSIQHLQKNPKNKNPKIPSLKLSQKLQNNYIQPSTIAKYKKSLYYYCKITSARKYTNKRCEIDYNNLNPIQTTINYIDNEYIRNNTRIESTCETVNNSKNNKNKHKRNKNISMSKIINPKKQAKLKGNKSRHHSCDLFHSKINGNSSMINLKIIKIQTIFKGYLVRKKVDKKLKKNKQFNIGFEKLISLLFIFKKNIFLIIKNNYINEKINEKHNLKYNNEICDEISISINRSKNEENNKKENHINNKVNDEKDIKSSNCINENENNSERNNKNSDRFENNIAKNYIEDSTNTDSNRVEVNNNENEKTSKYDELNNNYQNVINEKKQLEEKLNKTNDDYNKLKEQAKNLANISGLTASKNQTTQAIRNSVTQTTPTYTRSSGGSSVPQTITYETPDYSAWFNALTEINNQKYEALKQAVLQQKQRADEANNLNYARNLREWRKMYADRRNGQGLSNRLNIAYDRDSTSRAINETFDTNNLNALSSRYSDLASLTGNLANMDSNTIKKIMSTIQGWTI